MNDHEEKAARPKVSLYRCSCQHCDYAEEKLSRLALRYGAIFEVQRVDRDERLRGFAGWSTPIVAIDGVGITQFKVDVKAWEKALIERTGGKPPELVGFVVDMSCYFMRGVRPVGHEACALECFAAGGPVGIAALDGRIFLALPDKRDPALFQRLRKMPGEEVRVEGEIRYRDGVAGIVISRLGAP